MATIVTAKLIDGTEIIGSLVSETEETARIAYPLQVVYKYSLSSHVPEVTFARFMMFADLDEFDFQKVDLLVLAHAVREIAAIHAKMAADLYKAKPMIEDQDIQQQKAELYNKLLHTIPTDDMTKH